MSLRDAFSARTIDTSSNDIVGDFFVPMLQNATRYDRGVEDVSSSPVRSGHMVGFIIEYIYKSEF
ncbi:MAG: hypothetical protein V5A22_04815 [Salinivenus sp.]